MFNLKIWSEYGNKLLESSKFSGVLEITTTKEEKIGRYSFKVIDTGLHLEFSHIEIPEPFNLEVQIRPKQSLSRLGLMYAISPIIYSLDYKGSILITMFNNSRECDVILDERSVIGELTIVPYLKVLPEYIDEFQYKSKANINDSVVQQKRFYIKDKNDNREYISTKKLVRKK